MVKNFLSALHALCVNSFRVSIRENKWHVTKAIGFRKGIDLRGGGWFKEIEIKLKVLFFCVLCEQNTQMKQQKKNDGKNAVDASQS